MAYEISWFETGTIIELSGAVSIDEIIEANEQLYGDARIDSHRYTVWSFTDADLSSVMVEDIIIPAATDGAAALSIPHMRVAIVAIESHATNILGHYIQSASEFTKSWEFGMFTSMESAVEWANAE